MSGQPEGGSDKEVTGDTDDEIEEIEGTGDPVIMSADGKTELEEAEIEAQQRRERLQHARDQRSADQLARSAADHDESTSLEGKHLGHRVLARLERMQPVT
eukprot:jgi/Tetstr1/466494/TSEL_011001.t1